MESSTITTPSAAPLEAAYSKDAHLTTDQLLLQAQGHKEEMPRQFSLLAAVSLAFSITNSWIAISAIFQQPLTAGGGPGVFYSLLVACFSCFIISKIRPNPTSPSFANS
jgi:choline transport protein